MRHGVRSQLLTADANAYKEVPIDAGLTLEPAESHDVYGPVGAWEYRLTVAVPSQTLTYDRLPAAAVIHATYATDADRPWRGLGPLQVARLAGRLSSETSAALADEVSGPRGSILPVPKNDPTLATFKDDVKNAAGKLLTVQAGDWNAASGDRAVAWEAKRFGASPPAALVEQARLAYAEVVGACGLTVDLFMGGDAGGQRESYRRALHTVIAPLGRLVAAELSAKLEAEIGLSWEELRAGDIAGRARAFASLVQAGKSTDEAARLTGLLAPE